jgi:hypothetical protein
MPRAQCAVLAAFLLFTCQTLSQHQHPVIVGVVATSGGIHPLARLGPEGWIHTWPDAGEDGAPVPPLREIPREWMDGPVPLEWRFHPFEGKARPIAVTGTERCCGCVAPVLLQTDCGAACSANDVWFSGIALSGHLPILPLSTRAPKEAGFARAVRAAFDAAVPLVAAEYERNGDVFPAAIGSSYRDVDPIVERVYALERGRTMTAYVEAERRFSVEDAPNLLVLSGWFRRTSAGFVPVGVEVAVSHTDEDKSERRDMLGVLDDAGGPTWVATITTYEHGAHALIRLDHDKVRHILSVERGGC